MSKGMWWGIVIVVVVAIIAGYWYSRGPSAAAPVAEGGSAAKGSPQTPSTASPTLPSGSDSSDAALNADLNAIDSQTNAFSSDNAAVDSGLSDQEVQQSSL